MDYLLLIFGLVILVIGGELLVKGAVVVAKFFGLSSLVIGMTVVSFGTSMPELIVSINAAIQGVPAISIGNVMGSNIANIALVLGLTAIIFPLPVDRNSIRIDWPVMFFATLMFLFFALYNDSDTYLLGSLESFVLFAFLIGFIIFIIRYSRKLNLKADSDIEEEKIDNSLKFKLLHFLFIILGCSGLAFGAKFLVDGAIGIAETFGVSERVISVTILAFGTSVPELATSIIAAIRKETNILIGNLIGSNLFNIACILGITGMITEIPIESKFITNDMYWMIGISLILFPFLVFGKKVNRVEGSILFLLYIIYIIFLF